MSLSRADLRALLVIALVFAASRLWLAAQGVAFQCGNIQSYWQYLDKPLLRDDLLRSLWYLHAQPPLFNALIGLSLKLFPGGWDIALHALFMAMGLGMNMALYLLLRQTGVGGMLSLPAVLVYALSPSQMLYENYFFYSYPTAFVVTLMACACWRVVAHGSARAAHALMWLACALALLRGSYHLLFMLLPAALLARKFGVGMALKMALLPLLLVFLWYGKNFFLFGFFGSSSWGGMNAARVTLMQLQQEGRTQLAEKLGEPLALYDPFKPLANYGAAITLPQLVEPSVLYAPLKHNGQPNFNHISYIELSQRYAALAWHVLREQPWLYAKTVTQGFAMSFGPTDQYFVFDELRQPISAYADAYNLLVLWAVKRDLTDPQGEIQVKPSLLLFVLLPLLCLRLWRANRPHRPHAQPLLRLFLLCLFVFIAYSLCAHNLLEIGENNRFRFDWEPLAVLLLTLGLRQSAYSLCERRSASQP